MLSWFKVKHELPKEYSHLVDLGFRLEMLVDKWIYTYSHPEKRIEKDTLTTYVNLTKLAELKASIDSLLQRIFQQIVMITGGEEKIISDLQKFRMWTAVHEQKMNFRDRLDTYAFVNYISVVKSFLESYFYDALNEFSKTNAELSKIFMSRAGIIVKPAEWEKEMKKFGESVGLESKA